MTLNTEVINTKTKKRFINLEAQCNALHNNKYTYDNAIFINMRTKFIVTCPEHGDFEITPDKHTSRKQGCQVCANTLIGNQKRKSFKWFLVKANLIHAGKYLYNEKSYIDTKMKTKIICPTHGDFMQSPDNHLRGKGCPKCNIDKVTKTRATFISEASLLHDGRYIYTVSEYVNSYTNITIECSKCDKQFQQTPRNHLKGSGCPTCAEHGFNRNKPAILYYLSVNNGEAYKIGITNRTVAERYNSIDLANITVLLTKQFEYGEDALALEKKLLKAYSKYKYIGPDLLQSGNTELITKDITNEI